MKSPSRMDKDEIREELMSRNYTSEQLDGKTRAELLDLFKSHKDGEAGKVALTTVVEEADVAEGVTEKKDEAEKLPKVPTFLDAEWTQYVLGQFVPEEMDGTNPRVEGLRRVAEKLVGQISEEGCDLVAAPTMDNGNRACVKAWVEFRCQNGKRRFEALADVSSDNCSDEFARFPTSMAETRAKGRCYRSALKLRRVIAAEEAGGVPMSGGQAGNEQVIQAGQKSVIQIMANRMGVSIPAVLIHLEIGKEKLDLLSYTEALIVAKQLNSLQQMGLENIPNKLKRA